jgi:hypothetical protein
LRFDCTPAGGKTVCRWAVFARKLLKSLIENFVQFDVIV